MKGKIIAMVNITMAVYFFILANGFFWGSFMLFDKVLTPNQLMINVIFGISLMLGAIMFFRKSKEKYFYGVILLGVIWIETSLFLILKFKEINFSTILSLGMIFGIPIVIMLLIRHFDKKQKFI